MERRFEPPWRATALGVVALALLAFALFLLLEDGGSEPRGGPERSATRIDTEESADPAEAAPVPSEAVSGNVSKAPAKTEDSGSEGGRSQSAPSQGSDPREEPAAAPASGGACPAEISREECEMLAAAAADGDRSVAIRKPSDCLKVMSRAECIELLRDQKAAAAQGDSSVSVEECLDGDAPREACKAHFEQMREASQ